MKDSKSLAWLLPLAGLLILFGWFLGRAGWNFSKLNVGIGELEPPTATSISQTAKSEHSTASSSTPVQPSPVPTQRGPQTQPTTIPTAMQITGPFREHHKTSTVGSGLLAQGTYSDGLAPFSESEITQHLNIQRIRLEEYPDGCGIAFLDANKIWLGSSVRTKLTINDKVVGEIFGPTGKHGYVFDITIRKGDKICVTYFEPSGFHIIFGPDVYYHYDSYCYRGQCN
jgi:hypothetical protein